MQQISLGLLAGAALAASAGAQQLDDRWLEFVQNTGSMDLTATEVSDDDHETDMAWADLDKNGLTDLVVVRKIPFTFAGGRTNLLFMNEGGVLFDRSEEFASATDVAGDQGFLTPTNDRDVVIADVDGDTWLDVITAVTISHDLSKQLGHPRVYRNLGEGEGGAWLGLRYEDARIPQLFTAAGRPENPRFCAVDAGDVDGDGDVDLFFGDYDESTVIGDPQPVGADINDRLLLNDGNGFFTDATDLNLSPAQSETVFTMAAEIADLNGDGAVDIIKCDGQPNRDVSVYYNDDQSPGSFPISDVAHEFEPYHITTGDLNNDGRPDLVVSDDQQDRYRLNEGTDVFGRVIWGPATQFDFLADAENTFSGNNLIVDLDNDGWNEVIICSIDVDVIFSFGYTRIYHNRSDTPGAPPVLLEERESAGAGWLGAVGLTEDLLFGSHDVAVFDIEGDGDQDMVLSRNEGTEVWINQVVPNHAYWDKPSVSVTDGGSQTIRIAAGDGHAGQPYLVLGSLSGTAPGIPLGGGHVLPLVVDELFTQSLTTPNAPPYTGSFGTLDTAGEATTTLTIPAGALPALAGLTAHHAHVVIDVLGGTQGVLQVGPAVPLVFEP